MVVFGKWPLWVLIGLFTLLIGGALAAGGQPVIGVALIVIVAVGGYYALAGATKY